MRHACRRSGETGYVGGVSTHEPHLPEDDLVLTAADRAARMEDLRAAVADALRDPATVTPDEAARIRAAAEERSAAARGRWVARANRQIAARRSDRDAA